jgi:outer membrane lipoprotein LolB
LLAGCALRPKTTHLTLESTSTWRGRIAVHVAETPSRFFSAGFEVTGTVAFGEMTLFNPWGGAAATLSWDTEKATMRIGEDIQYFDSLNDLIKQAVGVEIPVYALFAWLAGDDVIADGWNANLSQYATGRISAKRLEPSPLVELRLVLEKN